METSSSSGDIEIVAISVNYRRLNTPGRKARRGRAAGPDFPGLVGHFLENVGPFSVIF